MSTLSPFTEDDFRKASRSEPQRDCVHVARRDGVTQFRDSKIGFGAVDDGRLTVSTEQFSAFVRAVRS